MSNRSQVVVEGFAGLDVSAREISVARRQGKEEKPVVASFANNASFWPTWCWEPSASASAWKPAAITASIWPWLCMLTAR
jgi:hypothetical protein